MNPRFGICKLSLVPLRSEPSDRSEMTSQLLFGDHFTLSETNGNWIRIITAFDDYEGWIDIKQYSEIGAGAFADLSNFNCILGLSTAHKIFKTDSNEVFTVLAGSNIPQAVDNYFYMGDSRYKLEGSAARPNRDLFRKGIAEAAKFYLNAPYLWGGRSIYGIDCSGFCQMVFRQFGIRLKRDAWQQAEQGDLIGFLQEAKAGDLAFFDNDEGKITHVGIMLSPDRIIHASGRVKIDAIDNHGIFCLETKRYTHKLRILKKFGY